jgi:phage-related minor tail protein
MAIKYTEEQLNTVDKSIIIQMFLNQQEELSKAVNQIEQLTKEVQSGNDKLQRMMEQIILFQQCPLRTFFRKDG